MDTMSTYVTRKTTADAKAETLARRAARRAKYATTSL